MLPREVIVRGVIKSPLARGRELDWRPLNNNTPLYQMPMPMIMLEITCQWRKTTKGVSRALRR